MDLRKTAREIGLFETAINLSTVCDSAEVIHKAGDSLPLPDKDIRCKTRQIADWLLRFEKNKYMFLSPEIALIEEMSKRTDRPIEAIIAVPCDLEEDAKNRLRNNLPHGIAVSVLDEPYFPPSFFPGNGLIVISGYAGGNRAMVLQDTYRIVEHYKSFFGKKVFVPYVELDSASRYNDWMEINSQSISAKWRYMNE